MRLLTRSDFDGLACGALLKKLGIIDSWKFVHPKDAQDRAIEVTDQDVLANVPYIPGCGMWFDHHSSEISRMRLEKQVPGACRLAPSAARVVYEYYDGDKTIPHFKDMVAAVDKVDSGRISIDEIQHPMGWVLLGFIMDPRTGLGRFGELSISNHDLMLKLMDCCATMNIDEILALRDVRERVKIYEEQSALFEEMIRKYTTVNGNVILTDLRGVETIYTGNRFMLYSLYPEQNVSVWVVDGRNKLNCPIAVGYSVLNRTCVSNVGELMYKYGGGGHAMVGTCQVDYNEADTAIEDIVGTLIEDDRNIRNL